MNSKLFSFILILFLLLNPCVAGASDNEKLKVISSNAGIGSITDSTIASNVKFNSTNQTVTVNPEHGVSVQSSTNSTNHMVGVKSSTNSMNAGQEMIVGAVEQIPVKATDGMLAQSFGVMPGNLSNASNYTAPQKLVYSIAAAEQDPGNVSWVNEQRRNDYTAYVLSGLIIIVCSAGYFFFQKIVPEKTGEITEWISGAQQFIGYEQYIKTLFLLIAMPTILPLLFDYSIKFEQAMSSGIMLDSLQFIPFPSDNIPLYVFQGISYLLSGFFFLARVHWINIVYAKVLIVALCICIPWKPIRILGIGTLLYFEAILFSRPFVLWINAVTIKHVLLLSTSQQMYLGPSFYVITMALTIGIIALTLAIPGIYALYLLFTSRAMGTIGRLGRRGKRIQNRIEINR